MRSGYTSGNEMLLQKALKYELRPSGATRRAFARFAGAKRFVWNRMLAQPKYRGFAENCALLPSLKREYPWLKEAHSQVLQQGLKDLDRGFKNFFEKRAERPSFKKKFKSGDSFRFPQGFRVEEGNSRVYLPKIGWVRYRNSRPLSGDAKNVTISRQAGKWFISIQTESEIAEPTHPATSIVGIDLGVSRFATFSDGEYIDPLNVLKRHQAGLRRYQRRMARKQKFSRNWTLAKGKVQKQHTKVANSRRDFLHKASTKISENQAIVVMEDLQVKNMSASAAGTVAEPGRNVKQKSSLNKAILDQGWGEFRRMLEYKQRWHGGRVVAVPAMNTSRTCPECGQVSKDNRKTQAVFACVACGYAAHADFVGARNILAAGHAVLACGGVLEVGGPVKQEPAEATLSYAQNAVGIPGFGRRGCQTAVAQRFVCGLPQCE